MLSKRILTLIFVVAFLTLLVGCLPSPIEENQAPIITSTPVETAKVGEAYTYDVEATDPDVGDTLTYTLDIKPTNMSISSATGLINWTPTVEGEFNVVVKVSDGDLDITQSFIITVVEEEEPYIPPVNHAPVITSSPITEAVMGVVYTYDVDATDSDGDTLTYSLTTNPSGMGINSANGIIDWIPTAVGGYAVEVKASDGNKSDTQNFTITVKTVDIAGIEVEPETMTLFEGEFEVIKSITATYKIKTGFEAPIPLGDCTYTSDPTGIVTVSGIGKVTAVKKGLTTITVTYASMTDTVEVTVLEPLPPVHNIDTDKYYDTIQLAIDDPLTLAYHTIEVSAGMYNLTSPIAVDKALTLTGDTGNPSSVVINAPTTGSDRDCFQVQVSNVIIQGFRMQNSYDWGSGTDGGENGGVMIGNSGGNTIMFEPGLIRDLSDVTITHCEFDNCSYGVYVYEAGDNITIDYNVLTRVWRPVIFYGCESGGGTWLQTCNNSISHNTMDGTGYPFYVNRQGYSADGSAENRGIEFGHAPFGNELTIDVQGLSITHNEISNYIRHAVILSVDGQYGTFNGTIDISYNTITDTAVDVTVGQGRHTVEVHGDYVQFSHNTVIDHAWYAFCGLNSHYKVHDNVISNTVPQLDAGHVAAIIVGDDADVYNNTLSGGLTGITLNGNRADVYDNTISGYTSISSDGKGGNGIFLYGGATGTINIYSNDISGCLIGIRDEASPAELGINSNNIHGNTNYGVSTIAASPINAENNWWGSEFGPKHNGFPANGGDAVSDNVDYSNWSMTQY